jgi:hypothetical protein
VNSPKRFVRPLASIRGELLLTHVKLAAPLCATSSPLMP